MEIVLTIFGSEGDVRPNLALGRALQHRGHVVRVLASPDSRSLAAAAGLAFQPVGSDVRALMTANARYYIDRPVRATGPMTRALKTDLRRQFRELPGLIGRPDLVIGSGLMLAGSSVAEAIGRPYCHAMFAPVALRSRAHGPVVFPFQRGTPMLNRLLWCLADAGLNLSLRGVLNRSRRRLGLAPVTRVYAHLAARVLLAVDPELAPLPADVAPPCARTGYWHLVSDAGLPPRVERFLDRGPPPVHIGFGSMGDPHGRRTARAVEQAIRWAGVRAVVQAGWAGLQVRESPQVLAFSGHLPHDRLFPHVAAVVHHGGAGTVSTAARAGVPQVLVPHLLDQYYWGRQVHRLGLGPRPLARRNLDPRALAAALREVVDDTGYRRRAAALSVPLRARDGVVEAVRLLPALVAA
jgi:UDP:flavonoid glycosyltransferase YjiC (YdhE family)